MCRIVYVYTFNLIYIAYCTINYLYCKNECMLGHKTGYLLNKLVPDFAQIFLGKRSLLRDSPHILY